MKNPTLLLIAVLTATICCIPVTGWSQESTTQAVAPDAGPAAAGVELTEEDHELLLSLKGERGGPYEVRTQPSEAQNAGSGKNRRSLVEEIEALDKVLSKASQVKTG